MAPRPSLLSDPGCLECAVAMSLVARILIVDNETQTRRYLRSGLTTHDFDVIEAHDGQEALLQLSISKPDIVVLDLDLPGVSGLDVIKQVRETSEIPIIVLTARSREADKIEALDSGADDYLTKPFGMGELLARIRTALRHRVQSTGTSPVFRVGDLTVDLVKRQVVRGGHEVKLTPREFAVLRVLVQNAGHVVTHHELLREVWGPTHLNDGQYLRLYVKQLRRKLEADPESPRYILTEPRVGYRLRDTEPAGSSA